MSIFKKKIPMPPESRFDKLNEDTLYLLVEQAYSMAGEYLRQAHEMNSEEVTVALHNCDTALSDTQAGIRSLLRRRLFLQEAAHKHL